jgi:hypothetical protein
MVEKNWKVVDLPDELKAVDFAHISIFDSDIWLSGDKGLVVFSKDGEKAGPLPICPKALRSIFFREYTR